MPCRNVENPMYDFSTDLDGELNQRYRPSLQGQDARVTSASITNAAFAPDGPPHRYQDAVRPDGSRADAQCAISAQTSWISGVDELLHQQTHSGAPAQTGVAHPNNVACQDCLLGMKGNNLQTGTPKCVALVSPGLQFVSSTRYCCS